MEENTNQQEQKQHITLQGYFPGVDDVSDFYGARTFNNIVGHQVGQHWVAVITSEDETLVFRASDIQAIRVWKE